ncbi:hypothetical protein JOQ06_021194 [Pogonophryne albipinna]|uniref:Uncharacterized protein n=1 Tax=Pogonophryne albipinna TaxID=1090488 RepID=A0AAD6FV79_9TELE|nr:hypothetical protein JOQ06_021194 [Pogonophryne albipinna]
MPEDRGDTTGKSNSQLSFSPPPFFLSFGIHRLCTASVEGEEDKYTSDGEKTTHADTYGLQDTGEKTGSI